LIKIHISKIDILKTAYRNHDADWGSQVCFSYDRGLNLDKAEGLVEKIIEELEQLPKLFE
jgi:hypothetical protein